MRIAWLGPPPADEGGVLGAGLLLVRSLATLGIRVDLFCATGQADVSPDLRLQEGVRVIDEHQHWDWDRWYSSGAVNPLTSVTERITRAQAQHRLLTRLGLRDDEHPYDAVYQFSQPELLGLGRRADLLGRVAVHPQVHAAGELRWLRRERSLTSEIGSRAHRGIATATLSARVRLQRRDLPKAGLVVAPSGVFGRALVDDCGVDPSALRVVPNPIDLQRFSPMTEPLESGPLRVLFVARLSVRKGVELVVELSRRLRSMAADLEIIVAGFPSQWSDYRSVLDGLDPTVGRFIGEVHGQALVELYRSADVCLVPSHYEPFGLTAGEALSCGVPVVASDQVGALEHMDSSAIERFAAGDIDGLEHAVRTLIARVDSDREGTRAAARELAEGRFDPLDIGLRLISALAALPPAN